MAEVLYRKYRPQKFGEVTDQNHIRITLQSQIESDKLAHAYLFCGPRGVSKTTIARILAKTVNCETRSAQESEPCNECRSCTDIVHGKSLDVIEIDAASHTGVDNVRENIIDNARFHPTTSRYKVYIIDEVHMLSTSAFNALLKTLEEPPAYVIFILVTTESHKIPATIVSRCQRFDFKKISTVDIVSALKTIVIKENREVDIGVLESVARNADGCLRDALSLLDQVLSFGDQKITLDQVELILPPSYFESVLELAGYLVNKDAARALSLINRVAQNGADILYFTDELIEIFRKLLVSKVTESLDSFSLDVTPETLKRIASLLSACDRDWIVTSLDVLLKKRQDVKVAKITQLPLEICSVQIVSVHVSRTTPTYRPENERTFRGGSIDREQVAKIDSGDARVASLEDALEDSSSTHTEHHASQQPLKSVAEVGVSIEQVRNRWNELVRSISEEHHSLSLLLQVARPIEFRDYTLVIGFQFKLHKERVNEVKNRGIVSDRLAELHGCKMAIECAVSDEAKINV